MRSFLTVLLCCVTTLTAFTQTSLLADKASTFINGLDNKLKQQISFPFSDGERFNWNFVPMARKGVPFADLTEAQQQSVLEILKLSLSDQGYKKATGILELESILREVEGRQEGDGYRNPMKYYVSFFGKPDPKELWGWRLEGHHLSLNFSSLDGTIKASTPNFLGANPAVVPSGSRKGHQVLAEETNLALSLVNSLSADQLKTARFSERALPEIVMGNKIKAGQLQPEGINYMKLTIAQREVFLDLLDVYVKNYEFGFSNKLMEKIRKAGIDNLSFAWAGGLKQGEGHYYRIQGPMLLIEYDNTQTNANHVHTAVRDLTNDFAEDIILEHYQKDHKN